MSDNYKKLVLPLSAIETKAASSTQGSAEGGNGFHNAFDDKLNTKWEATWTNPPATVDFTFKFGEAQSITGIEYITRRDNNIAGTPNGYKLATSTDGITYTAVSGFESDIPVPHKLGTHSIEFPQAVFTQYLKVTMTGAHALTEWKFYYVPSTTADLASLDTEIDTLRSGIHVSLDKGGYAQEFVDSFDAALIVAKALPATTTEEKQLKGATLFNLASDLKRGIQTESTVLGTSITEANILLNSATVGTTPLTWAQVDIDAFDAIITNAKQLTEEVLRQYGDVYDAKAALEQGIKDFRANSIKPTITGSTSLMTNLKTNLSTLMDGTTEKRFDINNTSTLFGENYYVEFDYQQEARFVNMELKSWFASTQGAKQIKIWYWDNATSEYKVAQGNIGGTAVADGVYTLGWTSDVNVTETKVINFTPFDTTKIKVAFMQNTSDGTRLDEVAFGIDVDPSKIVVTVTPETASLFETEQVALSSSVLPFYASNKEVIWSSSNDTVATVDANGVVKALRTLDGAESTVVNITATSAVSSEKFDTCEVTVKLRPATEEQLAEFTKRIEIQNKYVAKATTTHSSSAITTFTNKLNALAAQSETATGGEMVELTKEIATAREDFDLEDGSIITNVKALIDRIAGVGSSTRFTLEVIPKDATTGMDVFEVDWADGKPVLRGNDAGTLATAFNYYLKYFCYQDFPFTGDFAIALPESLPQVNELFRNVYTFEYRHYFNENCEYKYTVDIYTEQQWRHRLDWMAMNGFNSYLFDFDTRIIWEEIAKSGKLGEGFNDAAMAELYKSTGINYTPDFGNFALSPEAIERDRVMSKKVMNWSVELGLEPEMRPFYGFVPFMFPNNRDDYYKSYKAQFTIDLPNTIFDGVYGYSAARWMNMPQGISLSYFVGDSGASDEIKTKMQESYNTISDLYYEYMQKIYFDDRGETIKHIIKDFVQEQGFIVQNAAYPREMITKIEQDGKSVNPDMMLIMSAWRYNAWITDYLDKSTTMVLDLQCETSPRYTSTEEFYGTNWAWCIINNFGGNTGIGGSFNKLANDPLTVAKNTNYMKGIGIAPEGADTDPALYALMAENAWRSEPVDVAQWTQQYMMRRYGKDNYTAAKTELDAAWDGLRATVYSGFPTQGPHQFLVNAYPSIEGAQARVYGSNTAVYKNNKKAIFPIWENMINAANKMDTLTPQFKYDLVDFTRQFMGDMSQEVYGKIAPAYKSGDKAKTLSWIQLMIDLCADIDKVLATNENFLLGKKLEGARARGITAAEKDYFEEYERTWYTIWIADNANPGGGLLDYTNKQYSGLMTDYYMMRWQEMYKAVDTAMTNGVNFSEYRNNNEKALRTVINGKVLTFTNTSSTVKGYKTTVEGDSFEVSSELLEKYKPLITELYGVKFEVNKDSLQQYVDTYKDTTRPAGSEEQYWTAFSQALTQAQAVLANQDATQAEVNQAQKNLVDTYKAMMDSVGLVDKSALQIEYDLKSAIEKGKYSTETWDIFQDALTKAKAVLDNDNATSADVDKALTDLAAGFAQLREDVVVVVPPDKTQLNTNIEIYEVYKQSDYESGWDNFAAKLAAAKAVAANADATLEQVNTANSELVEAAQALVKKTVAEKKGCGSAIESSSALIAMLAIIALGAVLTVTLKRKQNKN